MEADIPVAVSAAELALIEAHRAAQVLADADNAAARGDERSQDEIVAQARVLLCDAGADRWSNATLHTLFSLALTWCHVSRGNYYDETAANCLLRRIVFDAREMFAGPKPRKPQAADVAQA